MRVVCVSGDPAATTSGAAGPPVPAEARESLPPACALRGGGQVTTPAPPGPTRGNAARDWYADEVKRTAAVAAMLLSALTACAGTPMASREPSAATARSAVVHLSPTCTCCTEYAALLRRAGWSVEEIQEDDTSALKRSQGIPESAWACHTTVIDGYLIEGHVPLSAIDRLLAERPAIDGIALPGMPPGSPGMSGVADGPMLVVAFDDGEVSPYGEY